MMQGRALLAVGTAMSILTFSFGAVAEATPCWQPPVTGPIVDPFRAPPCRYCAGHRGIDFRTGAASAVRSVAAGRVAFSGPVAGTIYVVVEHANGWKVTYGELSGVRVRRGVSVARGAVLGTADGRFHFGLRVDGRYRDPEPYLGHLVGRPRLVPIDGTARRSGPTPVWSCAR
ncbi:MAG: M23 family metallopeptidase [Ilumatobacter sp.]|nr:M23 family metallopeptidase [Ilumatobacter sp.]MBT5864556.1 M23 family metallopeptidase [Ilumatobacter sp.]